MGYKGKILKDLISPYLSNYGGYYITYVSKFPLNVHRARLTKKYLPVPEEQGYVTRNGPAGCSPEPAALEPPKS